MNKCLCNGNRSLLHLKMSIEVFTFNTLTRDQFSVILDADCTLNQARETIVKSLSIDNSSKITFDDEEIHGDSHISSLGLESESIIQIRPNDRCCIVIQLEEMNIEASESNLLEYSKSGDVDVVDLLLRAGISKDIKGSYKGFKDNYMPIHFAAKNGHTEVVKLFLDAGQDVDVIGGTDNTILIIASEIGNVDMAKMAIEYGAYIDHISEDSTPLHLAVNGRHTDIVKLLLDNGADINKLDCYKLKPVHIAADTASIDIFLLLMNRGANVNDCAGYRIPLSYAVTKSHMIFIDGEFVDAIYMKDKLDFVKMLISKGADVNFVHSNGKSILDTVSEEKMPEMYELLKHNGAKSARCDCASA